MQLEMFPDSLRFERIDPDENMYRFYRMRLQPDLFGQVSLIREWGRIGTSGRNMVECFANIGEATDAMLAIREVKEGRGYQRTD